ncbi:MAG: aromatic ring-hydroxylating dioxygenase subunit alpha [Deltaproteobacteria bacterium]|nr:aromatic ring-hydroxylating dioxygenase subunit alpha [Deltaproteobacteria bacterium]
MTRLEPRLSPPKTKPVTSVAKVSKAWYVLCPSTRLSETPLPIVVGGVPLVAFRDGSGQAAVLLDRCPHRNVPLSLGRVAESGNLQCAYHGWQFDGQGRCQLIPGLLDDAKGKGRNVTRYASCEQEGYVWVYLEPDTEPSSEPFHFPLIDDRAYTSVHYDLEMSGSIHAVAENALDVPHTAFLHGGLFRKANGKRQPIEVVIRRFADRVEAEYIGEKRPPGIAGRILAPQGGTVEHFDRFILPSIAQVEYRLGQKSHFLISAALTPVSDFLTRLFAVVSFRLPLPHSVVATVLRPVALRILKQDAEILARQTETISQFGGEQYVSTDLDILGQEIRRLLLQAERGDKLSQREPEIRHTTMLV